MMYFYHYQEAYEIQSFCFGLTNLTLGWKPQSDHLWTLIKAYAWVLPFCLPALCLNLPIWPLKTVMYFFQEVIKLKVVNFSPSIPLWSFVEPHDSPSDTMKLYLANINLTKSQTSQCFTGLLPLLKVAIMEINDRWMCYPPVQKGIPNVHICLQSA